MPSSNELARVVERQMDMLRAYQSRQDHIVRGLHSIQKLIGLGYPEAAVTAMKELMASDLAQARERVDNGMFAIDIAIKALESIPNLPGNDLDYPVAVEDKCADSLSQMEILVPEAFKKSSSKETS